MRSPERLQADFLEELIRMRAHLRREIELLLIDYGQGYRVDELLDLPGPVLLSKVSEALSERILFVLSSDLEQVDLFDRHIRHIEEQLKDAQEEPVGPLSEVRE